MAFKGWSSDAVEFFEGLEMDNSRDYWHAHKAIYDEKVRRPMEELLDELAKEFGEGKIFRPNRDVRFSLDKSPYKTNIAGTLAKGGYVSFSADGLGVGSGMYMPMPDQLERLRRAIADDKTGVALEKLVAKVRSSGIDVSAHDELKTAPKGYPKDHPRIELLRMKGLITWKQWPVAAWLRTAKAKGRIVEVLHAAKPINAWLDKHVGPTTMSMERR
ncbi:MAG TPA: DUF2461 domain-containing protein [Acidimicrobiales bacterium]|nr:DUF2461 domain-containing protein [Acidimicrobiales bacterium]